MFLHLLCLYLIELTWDGHMKYQTDDIKLRRVNTRIIDFTFPIWLVNFFITFIPDGNVFADLFEFELVQYTF
jgi:hypothetical protein